MNIDFAVEKLGKNNNFYRHDGTKITYWGPLVPSDPPHQQTEPTQAELEAAWAQVVADREATEYQRSREKEYPDHHDQLDALWHAMDDGTLTKVTAFYDPLKAVKDKYPKPE